MRLLEHGALALSAQADVAESVRAWESGDISSVTPPATLPKGFYPPSFAPPFQALVEALAAEDEALLSASFKSLLYEDEHCVGFLPAGPRNVGTLPNGINSTSFNKAGPGGVCARLHVLVIPKRRLYNAVLLRASDVPLLDHMASVGRRLVRALATADSFPEGGSSNLDSPLSLAEVRRFSTELRNCREGSDEEGRFQAYLPGGCDLAPPAARAATAELVTALQVHPNHSVGWLHLHVFAPALLTRAGLGYLSKVPEGGAAPGAMTPLAHVAAWAASRP